MSSKHYAVQFRSMRTAIHNIATFSVKDTAQEFYMFIDICNNLPEECVFDYDSLEHGDFIEIDYRNPPMNVQGRKLEYINSDNIPDVYNF